MTTETHQILSHEEIQHKIRRIAYQIYETFVDENEIIIAGIASNGFLFAEKLKVTLESICNIKITLCEVSIDKKNPLQRVKTSINSEKYENKCIVLVDDVLNSGTTLIYGVKHFLDITLKKFKTVVLVDRSHKKYPIKADFKGISLSTSLKEHVQVVFNKNNDVAFLQ